MVQSQRAFANSGVKVGSIGFGAMGAGSSFYGEPLPQAEVDTLLEKALEIGCNHWDTADIYTIFAENKMGYNEKQIGSFFKSHPGAREKVFLATKFGNTLEWKVRGDAAYVKQACKDSLERLQTDHIDLYYIHRKPEDVQLEETIKSMKELKDEGKIKYIGVSEFTVDELNRAEKVAHIDAVQIELSPWTPQVLSNGIFDWCKKNGTALVAYSPLGRGALTNDFSVDQLSDGDFRKNNPRFAKEAFEHNKQLVDYIKELASKKNCTAAQVSLAWILAADDSILPIPGTRRLKYLNENVGSADVKLTADEYKQLNDYINAFTPKGERYGGAMQAKSAF